MARLNLAIFILNNLNYFFNKKHCIKYKNFSQLYKTIFR